mmetsp:Transcript_63110/g.140628  ORF Transcript_63110/g.140628 Transcript_63110/m.140628 type:complete len:214 (+) Transcript_63110:1607-2248(+)
MRGLHALRRRDPGKGIVVAIALVLEVTAKGSLAVAGLALVHRGESALCAGGVGARVARGVLGDVGWDITLERGVAGRIAVRLARAACLTLRALHASSLDGVALVRGVVEAGFRAGLVVVALGLVVTRGADLARVLGRITLPLCELRAAVDARVLVDGALTGLARELALVIGGARADIADLALCSHELAKAEPLLGVAGPATPGTLGSICVDDF